MKIYLIYLILLIIIISFFYYNLYSTNIETFYTFFIPYYSDKKLFNYDLYSKKLYNNLELEDVYNYEPFKIGTNLKKNQFLELITKIILEYSNILHIKYIDYNDNEKLLKDLNSNKIQLTSTSYASYDQFNDLDNIRYVCTTDIKYIYICKRVDNTELKNLSYIKKNTKIGVLDKNESYIFIKSLMEFMKLEKNIDYKLVIYNSKEKLLHDLNKNIVNICVFNDIYPIDIFFKYRDLKLMELSGFRKIIFFEQYKEYYSTKLINLNNFGSQYMPKNYNGKIYSTFDPYFNVVIYDSLLLTNNDANDTYISEILTSIDNNIDLLNILPQYAKSNIKYNTSIMNSVVDGIRPSNATIKYLEDNGYASNIDNINCKYFVGKNKCNKKNLLLL
jgi:hypothetical protein